MSLLSSSTPISRYFNSGYMSPTLLNGLMSNMDAMAFLNNMGFLATAARNTIRGTVGNDLLQGTANDDMIDALAGNDTVYGNAGNDQIFGREGNDSLYGGVGRDTLDGGAGDDILYGGDDNDALFGISGNDRLFGGNGNDFLDGGGGNDFVSGDAGNDFLIGNIDSDRLYGGAGEDTLTANAGNDFMMGGLGNDTYVYNKGDGQDVIYDSYVRPIAITQADLLFPGLKNNDLPFIESDSGLNATQSSTFTRFGSPTPQVASPQGNDTLKFGKDLHKRDIAFFRNGNDLQIGIIDSSIAAPIPVVTGKITVIDQFLDPITTTVTIRPPRIIGYVGDPSALLSGNVYLLPEDGPIDLSMPYYGIFVPPVELPATQATLVSGESQIENFRITEDNVNLTNIELNKVIEQVTAYATRNRISLNSVEDVARNAALMNIIASSWHA